MEKSEQISEELHKWQKENDIWTTPEVLEIRAYNEEQHRIADAWRAEHPFEEHIRACLLDMNNSVAIAEAAKYYVEQCIKTN